jgi:alkanesulfonate monooxygenase SsuD/methylene tetrahydromethanopterin reductase-like flavin-dependent oxidoreductase (luciferase family)
MITAFITRERAKSEESEASTWRAPQEAQANNCSAGDRLFVGSAAAVKDRLAPLIEATQADELMITSMIYDHVARRHSYELLAQAFGLSMGASVS